MVWLTLCAVCRLFQPVSARYKMDEDHTLGTGGYAVVRRAVRRLDSVAVAIKIMKVGKPEGAGSEEEEEEEEEEEAGDGGEPAPDQERATLSFEEIMTEIEVVQRLKHPHIINIHEYFLHRSNCFIVMDLLHGVELMDALIAHGPYTEHDVQEIMAALLDAVGYMHLHGVTHRDIKLENLVLSRPAELGSVTIVDFGLAKAVRQPA
jgi:serine/threonine protein kinase